MTKPLTTAFGATVLAMTYYGAATTTSLIAFFLDTDPIASMIRAFLVIMICLFCIARPTRHQVAKRMLTVFGIGLIYVGCAALLTDQIINTAGYSMKPFDIFFAIEGGIIAIILGTEAVSAPRKRIKATRRQTRPSLKSAPALSVRTA